MRRVVITGLGTVNSLGNGRCRPPGSRMLEPARTGVHHDHVQFDASDHPLSRFCCKRRTGTPRTSFAGRRSFRKLDLVHHVRAQGLARRPWPTRGSTRPRSHDARGARALRHDHRHRHRRHHRASRNSTTVMLDRRARGASARTSSRASWPTPSAGQVAIKYGLLGTSLHDLERLRLGRARDRHGPGMSMQVAASADLVLTGGSESAIDEAGPSPASASAKALSTAQRRRPRHASRPFDKPSATAS